MSARLKSDPELELATIDALRGANELRDRLLLAVSTGTPAVSDLAYAVKVRVKEDYKIQDKVLLKRKKNPDYAVCNLRDVVGLRVITLYRLDALAIIPILVDLIQSGSDETSLFKPNSLEEIIIYTTNPKGDAQSLASRLMSWFTTRGLADIASVDDSPFNYTSIHLVAWGRGKYRDAYRDIPVEIQVRTAFEDVWGEIDHALKYKRTRAVESESHNLAERLQTSLAHLNVLKTMIDGIAQYADQIKLQITELDNDRLRSEVVKSIEEPLVRLGPLRDLPVWLREAVEAGYNRVRPALEAGSKLDPDEKLSILQAGLGKLNVAADMLETAQGLSKKTKRETGYVISMQRALVLFAIGNLGEGGAAQLDEASRIYADMEHQFPNRLVIKYRQAKVLDASGSRADAIEKLRQVQAQLLVERETTPKHHWLRAATPRVLGVLLWEEADALRRLDDETGKDQHLARRLTLLKEAFEVTKHAHEMQVKEEPASASAPTEHAKAANNLLYYALEYLEQAPAEAVLSDTVLNADLVRGYLTDLGANDLGAINDIRLLDTAMRAFRYLDDAEHAKIAARYLLDLVDTQHGVSGGVHLDDMIATARTMLN
jgi:ppGpp synthetase/RelA/SpoT-type nucleotidyltranferase